MYAVIVVLIIVLAVLLVLVVLAQNPKGGGLSSQFGGSGATQLMGVKKTGDFLEKLTWGFAISIFVLTMGTNFFIPQQTDVVDSPNIESAQDQNLNPGTLPVAPAGEAGTPIEDLGLTSDSDSVN